MDDRNALLLKMLLAAKDAVREVMEDTPGEPGYVAAFFCGVEGLAALAIASAEQDREKLFQALELCIQKIRAGEAPVIPLDWP